MIVCEYTFTREDPNDENYSMHEVDCYIYVPLPKRNGGENHRLFLRKNLITEEYELCRSFYASDYSGLEMGLDVIFKDKDLTQVIERANTERREVWPDKEDNTVCTHEQAHRHIRCNGRRS